MEGPKNKYYWNFSKGFTKIRDWNWYVNKELSVNLIFNLSSQFKKDLYFNNMRIY